MSHPNDARANPLLSDPIGPMLAKMAAPIGFAMLATFLFQVVDSYFVGQLGSDELAALGFAAGVYFLVVSLSIGVAVGVSALVAATLGEGDVAKASRYTSSAVALTFAASLWVALLGVPTIGLLFRALGAAPEVVPLIGEYMTVIYVGLPLLTVALVGNAAVRASGDVVRPEGAMMLAGVINLVLDYVLIFGAGPIPALGLQGAALATVISWVFVAMVTVALLAGKRLLTLQRVNRAEFDALVSFSLPAVATQVLVPVGGIVLTVLAAQSGSAVVAAVGVAVRIETLVLVGVFAVSVASVPLVAQNVGGHQPERVDALIRLATRTAVAWGLGTFLVMVAAAEPVAALFSDDPEVLWHTRLYFYVVAGSYAPLGALTIIASVLNGLQHPALSLRVLAVKTLALLLPLTVVGAFFGPVGLFIGLAAGNLLGAMYAHHVLGTLRAGHAVVRGTATGAPGAPVANAGTV